MESAISAATIAVIGGDEHCIVIAKPACDRDLPGWWYGIVTRVSDCSDVRALTHAAIEDHLVFSGRKSLGRVCPKVTRKVTVSIDNGEERAGTAPILIIGRAGRTGPEVGLLWLRLPWLPWLPWLHLNFSSSTGAEFWVSNLGRPEQHLVPI
jgi:hypothetical protein